MFRVLNNFAIALVGAIALVAGWSMLAKAAEPVDAQAAERGYRFLVDTPLVPPDFAEEIFDEVWTQWPEPLRTQAEQSTPAQRRQMAFTRYGLTSRPDDPAKPLQYVVGADGQWTLNCFGCHGGEVAGKNIPGLPNARFALQTLTDETRALKVSKQVALGRMDLGSIFVPLGTTNGTTNAVMFGVVLMHFRDPQLNVHRERGRPKLTNHDMEAPPWWHFKQKDYLYIDGFAAKGHRGLSQFGLVPTNGPDTFRAWEDNFRDVYAYISSLEAPKYPFDIDAKLAAAGQGVFSKNCAECHGTYASLSTKNNVGDYPERLVPIDEIGTDRVRLDALTPQHRAAYGASWFNDFGAKPNRNDPGGYVAPPLDGIWASAPYSHNGSVPTLELLLNSKKRPTVWRRSNDPAAYDTVHLGLDIKTYEKMPADVSDTAEQRTYFDTRQPGKSAAGHTFADGLSIDDRTALLEYLKTL